MATPRSALLIASMLLLVLVPAPGAVADPSFSEDWEDGSDGWTMTGLGGGVVCANETNGTGGCAYRVEPPCCSVWTTAMHDVAIPLAGRLALDFEFLPESLYGDTDSDLMVAFDDGTLVYETTNWYNNGLGLVTDQGSDQGFSYYWSPGEWIHLRLLLDGDQHLAQSQVISENGTVEAASRVLPFSGNATSMTAIGLRAINWGSPAAFQYDDLALATSASCFSPTVRIEGPWYAQVGTPATFLIDSTAEDCDPFAGWSIDFGDGGTGASGAPPANVTHTYGMGGYHHVTLTAELASGAQLTSTTYVYVEDPCAYVDLMIDGPDESRVNTTTTFTLAADVQPGCSPVAYWSVQLGDGTHVGGNIALPDGLSHTYRSTGGFIATLNVTLADGREFEASHWLHSYDVRVQSVTRAPLVEAYPVEVSDDGVVVLDEPAQWGARLRLTFDSPVPVGDVDAILYDAHGERMWDQPCRALFADEDCALPYGTAIVRVQGKAVLPQWTLEYEYRIA